MACCPFTNVCISEICFVPVVICVRDNFTKRRDIMWNLHVSFYIRFVCAMHIHSKCVSAFYRLISGKLLRLIIGGGTIQNISGNKTQKIRVILIQQVRLYGFDDRSAS